MSHMFVQKCILLWNSSFHSMPAKSLSFIWTHPQSRSSFQGWPIIDDASFLEAAWLCDTPTPVCPSLQFSSVAQSCPTLFDPMNHSMPGLPVHHQLSEFTQIHVHRVSDAIQPSHPLSSPSPPALNLSQHQGLFKWVSSLDQVAKLLEFQLQHQSFQRTPGTDLL